MFFFFKQKTAYEMRISDWSSDVCSSDLIEGVGLEEIAEEAARRHRAAYGKSSDTELDQGGAYAWRVHGEQHGWTPDSVADLQHAVLGELPDKYRSFAASINEQRRRLLTTTVPMELKPARTTVHNEQEETQQHIRTR